MHAALLLTHHADGLVTPRDLWSAWTWEPIAAAGLGLLAVWYAIGLHRLRRDAGPGRGLPRGAPWYFGAGLASVALALFSPLDRLGETLFAAHMVQHLVLMLVAAPLIALGAPLLPLLWTFSPSTRRAAGVWWHRRTVLRGAGGILMAPAAAWTLSVGALVLWHLPGPYRAALQHDAVHALEHVSFLGTSVLFWWVALRPDGYRRLHPGLAVLYVFTAGIPNGLLGALLTFAGRPLYAGQSVGAGLWGLTPLTDQQLAGLIMWMPGGAVHLAAAAAFFIAWLRAEEARGLREAAATLALMVVVILVVPGCRPRDNPRLGGDSTRTAGAPEMAQDSLAAGHAAKGSGFTRVGSIVGLSGPESVCYDPDQDAYFISSFNGTLTAKDNNGFISRVRPDGRIDSLKFIAGGRDGVTLNAPTGMVLVGDTLWVADVTGVRAFNARTGAAIATVDLSRFHPRLLNDLALGPDHALYITDTGIHLAGNGAIEHPGPDRVFRIGPDRRPSIVLAAGIEGPNGIAWDSAGRRFLIVSFTGERIYAWAPGQARPQTVAQGPGRFDGVVSLDGGRALVSSWADSSVYLLRGDSLTRVLSGLPEPADIGLDSRRHRLAIPVSSENRVELWLVPGG